MIVIWLYIVSLFYYEHVWVYFKMWNCKALSFLLLILLGTVELRVLNKKGKPMEITMPSVFCYGTDWNKKRFVFRQVGVRGYVYTFVQKTSIFSLNFTWCRRADQELNMQSFHKKSLSFFKDWFESHLWIYIIFLYSLFYISFIYFYYYQIISFCNFIICIYVVL